MRIHRYFLAAAVLLGSGCAENEFRWAFAQELDGSFHPSEVCRESLAQSLYAEDNREETIREGGSNIYLFTGSIQSYRVHAFQTQQECETALTGMVMRAGLTP